MGLGHDAAGAPDLYGMECPPPGGSPKAGCVSQERDDLLFKAPEAPSRQFSNPLGKLGCWNSGTRGGRGKSEHRDWLGLHTTAPPPCMVIGSGDKKFSRRPRLRIRETFFRELVPLFWETIFSCVGALCGTYVPSTRTVVVQHTAFSNFALVSLRTTITSD